MVLNKAGSHISLVNKLHYGYAWLIGSLLINSALDFKASCLILYMILLGSWGETGSLLQLVDLAACSGCHSACEATSWEIMGILASSWRLNRRSGWNQGQHVPLSPLAERRIGNPRTRYSTGCACQAVWDIRGSWKCWLTVFGIAFSGDHCWCSNEKYSRMFPLGCLSHFRLHKSSPQVCNNTLTNVLQVI